MIAQRFRNRQFMQFCWVVPDLDSSISEWARRGVGPFFLFENIDHSDARYRGHPHPQVDCRAAIAQAGEVQIELVCQYDNTSSIWRDFVPAGKIGLHHAALYCNDFDSDLAAYLNSGGKIIYEAGVKGYRACWFDTMEELGFFVQLMEANPIADSTFARFRDAAANWDGINPIRTLS